MKHAAIVLLACLLSACNTTPQRVDRMVGSGQPPAYKQGFAHGCDSGYMAAGDPYYQFRKDVRRFSADQLYRQGWEDGYSTCKGRYESIRL